MDELTEINCDHGGQGILWDVKTQKLFCAICEHIKNESSDSNIQKAPRSDREQPTDERHRIAIAILDNILLQFGNGFHPQQLISEMYKCNKIAVDVLSEMIENYQKDPTLSLEQLAIELRESFYECDHTKCKWPEDTK